jgi:hypothetical protein
MLDDGHIYLHFSSFPNIQLMNIISDIYGFCHRPPPHMEPWLKNPTNKSLWLKELRKSRKKVLKNEMFLNPLPLLTQNVTKLIVISLHIIRQSFKGHLN